MGATYFEPLFFFSFVCLFLIVLQLLLLVLLLAARGWRDTTTLEQVFP